MGQPVVHFEVIGRDGEKLRDYYSEMFGWEIDANNPMNYGNINRDDNLSTDGVGIGGGIAGYEGDEISTHVTFYVQVPDVEEALAKAEQLGGKRIMGPDEIPGANLVIGQFDDPEGHRIGVLTNL